MTVFPPVEIVDANRGLIRHAQDRVAIIGAGPGRETAPYGDPAWAVWALNEIWQPRYDLMFEMHPASVQDTRDLYCLRNQTSPVVVLDPDEWVAGFLASPVRYPIEQILKAYDRHFFTCTFAYQLALALWLGFREIGLWGCGLQYGTARERLVEKPCLDYWIGRAEGMGVTITEDSGLAHQQHLYGYAYQLEVADVNEQVAELEAVAEFERRLNAQKAP